MTFNTRLGVPMALAIVLAAPVAAQTAASAAPAAPAVSDPAPAAVPFVDAPPAPPAGVAASYAPPLRDASGAYLTPNRDLSPEETVWHVREALNVAALGCRDADEAATVAGYNALLANARAPLAAAQAAMAVQYKARYGAAAQAQNDDRMTRLYNFFAQTVAHDEFCAAAKDALRAAASLEPADLPAFAAAALPRLEAPFLAFFARYDAYRSVRAAWQARQAPVVVIATAAAVPALPPRP